jgi:hypothetical protein
MSSKRFPVISVSKDGTARGYTSVADYVFSTTEQDRACHFFLYQGSALTIKEAQTSAGVRRAEILEGEEILKLI